MGRRMVFNSTRRHHKRSRTRWCSIVGQHMETTITGCVCCTGTQQTCFGGLSMIILTYPHYFDVSTAAIMYFVRTLWINAHELMNMWQNAIILLIKIKIIYIYYFFQKQLHVTFTITFGNYFHACIFLSTHTTAFYTVTLSSFLRQSTIDFDLVSPDQNLPPSSSTFLRLRHSFVFDTRRPSILTWLAQIKYIFQHSCLFRAKHRITLFDLVSPFVFDIPSSSTLDGQAFWAG